MTNLEKMKNILIEQINGMDATEFEKLLGLFDGIYPDEGLD